MDYSRGSNGHEQSLVVVVSRKPEVIEAFQHIDPVYLGSIDDLSRRLEARAIILDRETAMPATVSWLHRSFPHTFLAVYDPASAEDPVFRMSCFDEGANMVAHDAQSLVRTLDTAVTGAGRSGGRFTCPYCRMPNLSEREMYFHCPAFHINHPNEAKMDECPMCRERLRSPLQVHIHMDHGPDKWSREDPHQPDGLTRLYNFSLVICRHPVTGKFLLCQEFANQGFWCPGGAVDPGEMLTVAAKRETLEEAGIDVELKGILSVEYNPIGRDHKQHNLIRLRVIFYAEPSRLGLTQLPKSIPDFESAGACWCTAEEILSQIRLRGSEPKRWVKYLRDGGAIYPLSLLDERSS